ncbi:MAG TPA: hydroxyisourate hydrolase [Candidatus Sulfopaludibacter sp.]|nr:hydroxyisourate hydrolase [Candidatus Sulfopaludibacter sp.]
MPTLSTHVLDTSRGLPAAGVVVELRSGERKLAAATGPDGRVPRDAFGDLPPGSYDLSFRAGDYFRERGVALADPPFLDEIVIRIGMADGHYHVPLLLSPYAYSTYRGS